MFEARTWASVACPRGPRWIAAFGACVVACTLSACGAGEDDETIGNSYSPDGSLEFAASGKSYLTVAPGCALNPNTRLAQPFVNLFDEGSFLLNVSVNGVPLTQLSALKPHTPVFLGRGQNVITAVNAGLSTDTYIRDGGTGSCALP